MQIHIHKNENIYIPLHPNKKYKKVHINSRIQLMNGNKIIDTYVMMSNSIIEFIPNIDLTSQNLFLMYKKCIIY